MTIENPRSPGNHQDISTLAIEIMEEFDAQGLILDLDQEFGGLKPDSFGFNVDDEVKGVNLGFLQIIFEPRGWTALAPQNELGIRSLSALAIALDSNPNQMKLTELSITYSMYQAYFPYKAPPKIIGF